MGTASKRRKPNERLRYQRHLRGWTLREVADKLYDLCASEEQRESGMSADTVGRWELGVSKPSLFYQQKLCALFGISAEDLGLIEPLPPPQAGLPGVASRGQPVAAVPLASSSQPIDLLAEVSGPAPEELVGAWLAAGTADLSALCAAGWTLEEVLSSLQVVLKGVQAMPNVSRRRLLQLGAAAVVSSVPIPEGRHISVEERANLHTALGESIAAGWKLFHTSSMPQVLAVGQAQLYLVQQAHSLLSSRERSMFYSSVYNLVGKATHFQGHYQQALDAHINAHVAAIATGDPWFVTQSLICQADSYQALEQHIQAIEAIEEALRIVGNPTDEVQIRSKAQLLASWADNAITLKEWILAEEKLEASATLLDQIHPNEQFDQASWLQLKGKYAFEKGDYGKATEHLEAALRRISPNWIVRQVLILLPLVAAYTWQGDRDACLATANMAFSAIKTLNAPTVNKLYATSLQGLLEEFPNDAQVRTFVADKVPQLHC
jgi:transcriptional regulator with XRE-family HTH domain/tetratricopeptide (TPR) repeat protein